MYIFFQTKLSRRLQFHKMRMHEVVKNNVCHLCGKGFITSSILSTHMKSTHSEVKEFICDKCGSKFNSMTTLYGMAIRVVEFWNGGTKLERFLTKNQQPPRKLLNFENWVNRDKLSSPSDNCKKLSHHFLLHFSIGIGSYDHNTKYLGLFFF